MAQLDIELICFRNKLPVERGGLGAAGHFRKAVEILWPVGTRKHFVWHPWAEKMLWAACEYNYLSVSGPGSSGKSDFFAVWGIVNWLSDPLNTMVLVTSTSLKDSRRRIWGSITDYFLAVPNMPGKLVDSLGLIRTVDTVSGVRASDRSGIALLSGDPSKEKENIGKIVGIKNQRVLLIGDELPELSPGLIAATSNLESNPEFQFIGIGNPNSIYDPHGVLSTPKDGWGSISPDSYEWQTERGYAIRFDAEKSPNVLEGKLIYPFLPTEEKLVRAREDLGTDSLLYWRMWRGFWCPEGSTSGIYSDVDLAVYGAMDDDVVWASPPTPVAGLDLAFSNEGDANIAAFGLLGSCTDGKTKLLVTDMLRLTEERGVQKPHMVQIAEQFVEACAERKVLPQHAGFDATAGGAIFGDFLREMWDSSIYAVDFGGAASTIPVGTLGVPACDRFDDRSSELWFVGRDFLRSDQLKGLPKILCEEMIARKAETRKRGELIMEIVESKRAMRKRTGKSPDYADAFFIMLDLCRHKLGFRSAVARLRNRMNARLWRKFSDKQEGAENSSVPVNLRKDIVTKLPGTKSRRKFTLRTLGEPGGTGWGVSSLR